MSKFKVTSLVAEANEASRSIPNSGLLRSDVPSVVVPKRLPIFSPNNILNASITSSCSIPAVIVLPDLNLAST